VAFDLGEKQSSPMSTHALLTVTCSTLRESKKSVFLGRAVAFLDTAVQITSVKETCFAAIHHVSVWPKTLGSVCTYTSRQSSSSKVNP
jgi:hypothetical protein